MQVLMNDMESYYNGYLFSKDRSERVYNTNMVFYFLDFLNRYGKYPENVMDANIKTDYKKIETLAFNFKDDEAVNELITEGEITTDLVERFNLEYMYERKENLVSLLYYMGMLTIKESRFRNYVLCIPNYTIRTVYWEYFLDKLVIKSNLSIQNQKLSRAVEGMAVKGEVSEFRTYFKEVIGSLSNRDLIGFNERNIKLILMTMFHINGIYLIHSEHEVEKGYADIFLVKNKAYEKLIKYEWLIELKYLKESERYDLKKIREEGTAQLERYGESRRINDRSNFENIRKLLIVVVGKQDVFVEFAG